VCPKSHFHGETNFHTGIRLISQKVQVQVMVYFVLPVGTIAIAMLLRK